ncbi:MAG: hypothetical protein AAF721_31995 [Myxococcota bacterium]
MHGTAAFRIQDCPRSTDSRPSPAMRAWRTLASMSSPRLRQLVLGSLLTALACGGDKKESTDQPGDVAQARPSVPAPAKSTIDLIAQLGDGGAVIVVLHDEGRKGLHALVQSALNGGAGPLADVLQPDDAAAGLWSLGRLIDVELPAAKFVGRDRTRPIVVSALEPMRHGPPGVAFAAMADNDQLLPLRFMALMPATDTGALVDSVIASLGPDVRPAPNLVADHDGARGAEIIGRFGGRIHVAALPEGDRVRVVLLHSGIGLADPELASLLDVNPVQPPDTPAMRLAAANGYPLTALVRPWQLRALSTWFGLREVERAVETVAMEQRTMARAKGWSIVSASELWMPDDLAEFDDWAFGLRREGEDGVAVSAVASLTERGQKIWRSGTGGTAAPFALKREVLADAWTAADAPTMIGAADKHALPMPLNVDALRSWQSCGWYCPMFVALRSPAAAGNTMSGLGVPSLGQVPIVHAALVDDVPGGPTWAIAVEGIDIDPALASALAGPLGPGVKVSRTRRNGHDVALFGNGVDPETVFSMDAAERTSTAVASADVRAGSLGLQETHARIWRDGQALTGELVTSGPAPGAPHYGELSWSSPMGAGARSDATDCLRDVVRIVHTDLGNAAAVSRDRQSEVLAEVATSIAQGVACATADPDVAPYGNRIGDTLTTLAATGMLEQLDFGGARRILGARCRAAGRKGTACEALAATGKISVAVPNGTSGRCHNLDEYGLELPVVVGDGEIVVAGRKVEASGPAIVAAIVAALPNEKRYEKRAPSLALIVDPDTPFKDLAPVLDAAAAFRGRFTVVFQERGARYLIASRTLRRTSVASVDWKVPEGYRPLPWEEEPPPEEPPEATPVEEGKMGKPSSKKKSGLYAMKGPEDAIPQMARSLKDAVVVHVRLTDSELTATFPGGPAEPIGLSELGTRLASSEHLDFGEHYEARVTIADDVPWSSVVAYATAVQCAGLTIAD